MRTALVKTLCELAGADDKVDLVERHDAAKGHRQSQDFQ